MLLKIAGALPFALRHRIKAHTRVVWGVAWSADSALFATASRDGSVKLWRSSALSNSAKPVATITLDQPVTAIAFEARKADAVSPSSEDGEHQYMLALGLETGSLSIHTVSDNAGAVSVSCLWKSPVNSSHCASVRRICWQAQPSDCCDDLSENSTHQARFATCADDHCIRIFRLERKH